MSDPAQRDRERVLTLDFECLQSVPGGINEVRVWYDALLGVEVVGKRLDQSIADEDALPEPRTLQAIDHPNVVPIKSAARVSDFRPPMSVIEIITPYYSRGSITDALLRGEKFSATDTSRIVTSALKGLQELHEVHGIVHRDVKSGNILLSDGYPWALVADLGLAGRMNDQGWVSALNNPTLYSPPEFIGTGRLTPASDIFAMGLVLRELLGGAFKYETYPTTEVVDKLMNLESPVRPADRDLPVWASRSVRRLYRKATMRAVADRYQTAREMSEALNRADFVDWTETSPNCWEADFVHSDKRIRVEATWKKKSEEYCFSTRTRRFGGWRRVYADALVPQLRSTQAREVFDQATNLACAR